MVYPYNGVLFSWKQNEEDLYELIESDFQDIMLSEKSKGQKSTYSMPLFM